MFVSVFQIKSFVAFGLALDFLVEEYAGNKGRFPPIKRRKKKSLFICTIEKAQGLINSLIEHEGIQNVGLTVVDEVCRAMILKPREGFWCSYGRHYLFHLLCCSCVQVETQVLNGFDWAEIFTEDSRGTLVMQIICVAGFVQSLACSTRKSASDTTIFTIPYFQQ